MVIRSSLNRIKYFVMLVVLMLGITIKSYSKNYYVKSTGNDNNRGLSNEQAWSTIAKVNASSFLAGDTIFFNKGDTWRETLIIPSSGTSAAYIVITSYGTGLAPKILGSTDVTAWTNDAGNIWYSNNEVTDPYNLPNYGNIYFKESDGDITWGRVEKAAKINLAIEYDWAWITNHLYIYSPTDPNTRYSGVEISQRNQSIDLDKHEYLTFNGLELAYSGSYGVTCGGIPYSELSGLIVKNCHIHHFGSKVGVWGGDGYALSLWYSDMLIKDNIIHDCGRRLISLYLYNQVIHPHDVIIEGNTLYDGYHTSGIDINTNASGSWENIIIRNNIFYQNTNSIDAAENPTVENIFIAEQGTLTGSVNDVYIYNNIFRNPNYYSILLEHASSIFIYNNTFYGDNPAATTLNGGFVGMSGAGSYTLKNNVFYNNISHSTNANFRCLSIASTTGTAISDYNLFYNIDESQTLVSWHSTGYAPSQWATYKTVSGQDVHSPTPDNPLFVSSSDYHLRAGSPTIGSGVNIGLKTDYEGNAFKNPPSIGAYEYDLKSTSPSLPVYQSSIVENVTPSVIEMTYSLALSSIVPAVSAFTVLVNSAVRSISFVSVSGTKVMLTLAAPIAFGDNVTVAYTKPASNPLQTSAGGQAVSLSAQTVSNKVNATVITPPVVVTPPLVVPNTPPIAVVNYVSGTYSGFVGELNASGSYDAERDNLSFIWKVPNNISVSATNSSVIEFLAPIVDVKQTYEFTLTLSDGKAAQSKTIPVEVLPYQPGLETAEVIAVEASDSQTPYLPYNIIDGNIGTMWSAIGSDQWIILELREAFNIQHIKVAFQPGQKKESYFDLLGSNDKENWEPVLAKSKSCAFSGDLQVFEFPPSKTEKEFRYVKLVGQGNSLDSWNYISELRIFGYRHKNPSDYEDLFVKIYPNPAHELVNILIDEPTFNPDFIKIVNLTGKVLYDGKVDPGIRQLQVPVNFRQGLYIIQMGIGDITMFTQKLVVIK
jgi:hypothetical protein